jgi:ATP-dependent helicase/nuclease subunit B
MRFLAERLKEILANAAAAVIIHIKKSGFKPAAVELAFGNTQFPAWEINCSDRKVYVYGKIDRVDVAKIQDKIYFRIIDYKSSPTKLDLSDFWHGLSLQLLLYMAMAKESVSSLFGGEDAEAAGAFYFGINPFYRRLPNPERKKEEEKEISKLEGLLLADPEVFQQMGGEELVNAKLKKDDSFTKYSRVAGRRELEQLYDFLKFKTAQLAKEILSGRAEVSPFKKENGNTACAYCPYKPFCCFDTAVAGNGYRLLKSYSHEEVLQSVAAWQKGDAENGR